jgi:hypothetical protein
MTLRLAFGAETAALGRKSSVSSPDHNGAGTLTSPSRFSLRGRRPEKEEQVARLGSSLELQA